jgi:nitrite reductase/ring-hydroxylating ferredoxin subunit
MVSGGALMSATLLDLLASDEASPAARRLVSLGLITAAPTALAGWSDWIDTEQAEQRVGLVHAISNITGLSAYALSWWQRRNGGSGRYAGLGGAAALSVGGWLGGHLAYAQGVGVDTTAFQSGPAEWTDVAVADEITDEPVSVEVSGVAVLLTRVHGRLVAIADRCTHRGGPLSDGERRGDCVVCPWHASEFDLTTGEVRRGPATRPQPRYEVRERGGRVEIRRHEPRSLAANPTGS